MKIKNLLRPIYAPIYNKYYDLFLGPKRVQQLFEQVRNNKAKNILEIGVFGGGTALSMIKIAQTFYKAEDINYYGFDLFEDLTEEQYKMEISRRPPTEDEVKTKLLKTGANINIYKGNTLQSLPATWESLPKMDVIYIDGGHSVETIDNDWKYTSKLMGPNTVVIFDDYWPNRIDGGCKPLIDSLNRDIYKVEILPVVDRFTNPDFGKLEIQYAKVMLNN